MKLRVAGGCAARCGEVLAYGRVANSLWWVTDEKQGMLQLFVSPWHEYIYIPRSYTDDDTTVVIDHIDNRQCMCRLDFMTSHREQNKVLREVLCLTFFKMFTTCSKTGATILLYGVHKGWQPKAQEVGLHDYDFVAYADIIDTMREIAAHICTEIADGQTFID